MLQVTSWRATQRQGVSLLSARSTLPGDVEHPGLPSFDNSFGPAYEVQSDSDGEESLTTATALGTLKALPNLCI